DTCEHRKVGDNLERMVRCMRELLERADALIVCGGLGPTPDDVTREAIAQLAGVPLVRHDELVSHVRSVFAETDRVMTENNLRQAELPDGATAIPNPQGTAPGVRCEVGSGDATKVVYAVPGVPSEMVRMVGDRVLPDLRDRAQTRAVILSRVLKTWGTSES